MTTVGILGAGLSGVMMGIELQRSGFDDFVIYEKQPDVGGTWLRNTYPGLHCDIPSHLYCYSFEPNPDWAMIYAGQAEIQAYIRACAEKYRLIDRIRFDTCVERANYDEESGSWILEMADGLTSQHRVLVSATGGLTEPRFPRIDGLQAFEGPLWHSGAWRHDVELRGKRVAVVGSAASAVQVVPEVAKQAAQVVVFSRTPNWVIPRHNATYTEDQKTALRSPKEWRRERRGQYRNAMLWFGAFNREERSTNRLRKLCLESMRSSIDEPALLAALTPSFDPGCKRILVSDDYYPALAQPHVELKAQGVASLSSGGVVTVEREEIPADIVIFCTGYRLGGRADGRAALDVYGRGGQTLRQSLAERTEAYRGIAVPGFPNYFTVVGVNGAVAHAPVFLSAEIDTEFIARCIHRLVDDDIHTIEASSEATSRYNERIQAELQAMSWSGNCPNFYLDATGRNVSFFPGSVGRMRRESRSADPQDFVVTAR